MGNEGGFKKVELLEDFEYVAKVIYINNKKSNKKSNDLEIAKNEKMERVNTNPKKRSGIFLKLFIYDLEKYLEIEITNELKKIYPDEEFSKTFLREVREKMPKKTKVKLGNNAWIIVDYDLLFEKLK